MTVICTVTLFYLPLFSSGYPDATGILISHTLPSPRTILGLLARGLGEISRLTPEQKINAIPVRLILQWALERSSFVAVRPLSLLKKSSQIWRVVWLEKSWKTWGKKGEGLKDAVEMEVVSTSMLIAYIFLELNKIDRSLHMYMPTRGRVTEEDIRLALLTAHVMGKSEMLCSPISTKVFESKDFNVKGSQGKLNTYCPLDWLKRFPNQGLKEDVLINLRLLKKSVDEPKEIIKYRYDKLPYVLPLVLERHTLNGRIIEYLKPIELDVELKDGYTLVELPDNGKVALPVEFLGR